MKTNITENLVNHPAVAKTVQPPAKHTPGPWISDPEEDHDITAGSLIVASVTGAPDGDPEAIANARLIAAAPDAPHRCADPDCIGGQKWKRLGDLLEAAKTALECMHGNEDSPGMRYHKAEVEKVLRAAITTAPGGV